jgi:hypothetical protein
MKKVMLVVLMTVSMGAHALDNKLGARSGNVSFGGIQVKLTVDPSQSSFQIGESKFISKVKKTKNGRVMTASRRVGIMTWEETLTATIFLDGGDGGNLEDYQEYNCTDVRITIVRTKDDGSREILKNECAFLD